MKKLSHPVAQVFDNMDGTYIFDFSEFVCAREREGERQIERWKHKVEEKFRGEGQGEGERGLEWEREWWENERGEEREEGLGEKERREAEREAEREAQHSWKERVEEKLVELEKEREREREWERKAEKELERVIIGKDAEREKLSDEIEAEEVKLRKTVEEIGREKGAGLQGELVVLLQHSQGYGAKFYPKKEHCLLGCAINRVLHKEPVALSSFLSSSPSPHSLSSSSHSLAPHALSSHIQHREKLEDGSKNEHFIPLLAQFSHIYVAGDSLALQMHASLAKILKSTRVSSVHTPPSPLLPRLPTHNPSEEELRHIYSKIMLHSNDLRCSLNGYPNSRFFKTSVKIASSIKKFIDSERQGMKQGGVRERNTREELWEGLNETRWEGEGVAVVINTGLWNLLGDSKLEVFDPLYSTHIVGLSQWIVDLKKRLPMGVKLFYREMFAPQIHRVHCDLEKQPHCHSRVKYLAQSRGKYLSTLQNLLMKQHGIPVLGVYHTSNEGTTQEGDGRHYIDELYNRLWRSWGTVRSQWVTATPCLYK
uniref:Uncharacterized protein n=1 Tax=Paramoeba aestuarina TaxID=180227 RepID=A0A7S4NZ04_9EUKA|mmetsp:Transcript_31914/g.49969  ORF Transcript_31914/g.49969 Transcript_31914/m.49969 type:complete len:539 (+) Transcript_31914:198-1814(+)